MKRFLIKLVILAFFVFVGLNISDSYYRDKNFFNRSIDTLKKSNNIGIFILGSSRAHSSYDPRIFEEELGIKTFNLGAPAQKFEATSVAISYALRDNQPKIAIVDIFALSIGKYYVEKNKIDQLQTLNQIPFSIYKSKKVMEVFGFQEFANSISTTVGNHSAWNEVFSGNYSDDYVISNGKDFYNGFCAFNKFIDDEMWENFIIQQEGKNEYQHKVELTLEEKNKIDEITLILENQGCLPVFVNAPTYYMEYDARNMKYSAKIGEYLKEKNSIYLDLNEWKDSLGLNKNHFSDPNHLNPKGAKITSVSLANYIKKNIDLKTGDLPQEYLKHNRYLHLKNNLETINLKKNIQDVSLQEEKNIKKIAVYDVASDLAELVIEVKDSNNVAIPVKITFDDVVIRKELNKVNLFSFAGKYYVVFPFYLGERELDNINIFIGNDEKHPIMKIKDKTTI